MKVSNLVYTALWSATCACGKRVEFRGLTGKASVAEAIKLGWVNGVCPVCLTRKDYQLNDIDKRVSDMATPQSVCFEWPQHDILFDDHWTYDGVQMHEIRVTDRASGEVIMEFFTPKASVVGEFGVAYRIVHDGRMRILVILCPKEFDRLPKTLKEWSQI